MHELPVTGKTYQIVCYNLDVIISVGYRVKFPRGTQLRIWATQRERIEEPTRTGTEEKEAMTN